MNIDYNAIEKMLDVRAEIRESNPYPYLHLSLIYITKSGVQQTHSGSTREKDKLCLILQEFHNRKMISEEHYKEIAKRAELLEQILLTLNYRP